MNIIFHETGKQLSENDLNRAENELNHPIPPPYRTFLLEKNGGYPEPCDLMITTNDNRHIKVSIDSFLGIAVPQGVSLQFYFDGYAHRMPPDLFPIACDPGGNIFCMSSSPENLGQIYFWEHDSEVEEGKQPTYENVYFVANNLEQLLARLT